MVLGGSSPIDTNKDGGKTFAKEEFEEPVNFLETFFGKDKVDSWFEKDPYRFKILLIIISQIGIEKFKKLVRCLEGLFDKDRVTSFIERDFDEFNKLIGIFSWMSIEEFKEIDDGVRRRYPFLLDTEGIFDKKYLEEAKTILERLSNPEELLDNPQRDEELRIALLSILLIYQNRFSLLDKTDYDKLRLKILLKAHFLIDHPTSYESFIISLPSFKPLNKAELIDSLGHETAHNHIPKGVNKVISEVIADLGASAILEEIGMQEAIDEVHNNRLAYKEMAEAKKHDLKVGQQHMTARAQLQWVIEGLQKADILIIWSMLFILAMKIIRKNPQTKFGDFIEKLLKRYKQEIEEIKPEVNSTWIDYGQIRDKKDDRIIPSEGEDKMISPEEIQEILLHSRKLPSPHPSGVQSPNRDGGRFFYLLSVLSVLRCIDRKVNIKFTQLFQGKSLTYLENFYSKKSSLNLKSLYNSYSEREDGGKKLSLNISSLKQIATFLRNRELDKEDIWYKIATDKGNSRLGFVLDISPSNLENYFSRIKPCLEDKKAVIFGGKGNYRNIDFSSQEEFVLKGEGKDGGRGFHLIKVLKEGNITHATSKALSEKPLYRTISNDGGMGQRVKDRTKVYRLSDDIPMFSISELKDFEERFSPETDRLTEIEAVKLKMLKFMQFSHLSSVFKRSREKFVDEEKYNEFYRYIFKVFKEEIEKDEKEYPERAARFLANIADIFRLPNIEKLNNLIRVFGKKMFIR